jgi:hypothetical protein
MDVNYRNSPNKVEIRTTYSNKKRRESTHTTLRDMSQYTAWLAYTRKRLEVDADCSFRTEIVSNG